MKKSIYTRAIFLLIACCLFFIANTFSQGTRLWATYYGGTGMEFGHNATTDAGGNVYLAGFTASVSGIASGGFQNTIDGGGGGLENDAFLVKFNNAGVRQWATYYGGIGAEGGYSVATDASGNVYLGGFTNSPSGIASGGFQNTLAGANDAFLVKFNNAGVRQWATYYGGTGEDYGNNVATDPSGNVYMGGRTASTTGIASGGFQNTYGGGANDAFLVKFNSVGVRQWATYYGGTGDEGGFSWDIAFVATDASDNVYLSGYTDSPSGIASGGWQNTLGGGIDAFLIKFNNAGVRQWATRRSRALSHPAPRRRHPADA